MVKVGNAVGDVIGNKNTRETVDIYYSCNNVFGSSTYKKKNCHVCIQWERWWEKCWKPGIPIWLELGKPMFL